jgi:hypothetical protein
VVQSIVTDGLVGTCLTVHPFDENPGTTSCISDFGWKPDGSYVNFVSVAAIVFVSISIAACELPAPKWLVEDLSAISAAQMRRGSLVERGVESLKSTILNSKVNRMANLGLPWEFGSMRLYRSNRAQIQPGGPCADRRGGPACRLPRGLARGDLPRSGESASARGGLEDLRTGHPVGSVHSRAPKASTECCITRLPGQPEADPIMIDYLLVHMAPSGETMDEAGAKSFIQKYNGQVFYDSSLMLANGAAARQAIRPSTVQSAPFLRLDFEQVLA